MLLLPLLAGSPSVLPDGDARAGLSVAVTTWSAFGGEGDAADLEIGQALGVEGTLAAAVGLTPRLELGVAVPGGYASARDCAAGVDCAAVGSLGRVGVEARYQLTHRPVALTPGLGLSSAAWNGGLRERVLLLDPPTTDLVPSLDVGRRWADERSFVEVSGRLAYAWRLAAYDEPTANLAPANEARASVFVTGGAGPVSAQARAAFRDRLGGLSAEGGDARWVSLDAEDLSVGLRLGVGLGERLDVFVEGDRVVWASMAPVDRLVVGAGATLAL